MNDIVGLLESELEAAFQVKDRKSLHRYVVMMVDRFASRETEQERFSQLDRTMGQGFTELEEDVRSIAESMRAGFSRMDERFEAMDRRFEARFEAMDRRFEEQNERFKARSDAVDKHFDDVNKRFNMLVVLMSVFFTVLAGMMTTLRIFL
ncbi:MAG: hypothetical protein ACLFS5_03360 [Spirochaetaceae bacterium]